LGTGGVACRCGVEGLGDAEDPGGAEDPGAEGPVSAEDPGGVGFPRTGANEAGGGHPAAAPPVAVAVSGRETEPTGSLRVVSRASADAVSVPGGPGRLVAAGDVA
jgi:hypothetical protein